MRRINSGIRLMNEPRPSAKQVRTVAGSSRSNKKTKEITQTEWLALFLWLRLQVTNSLTGVERYKSDTVCIELDRTNNEPRGGAAMNENERNYSAYLHNAVNSAAPIAKFSSFAQSSKSSSTK